MNETVKTILERRSVRKFTDAKIAKDDLLTLTQCGLHAPSARGTEKWHFTIINDDKLIDELKGIMQGLLNNENYNMYDPTALIIVSTDRTLKFGVDDNACALENIFLAATSLGIGSVWINQLRDFNDAPELRSFLDKLEVPSDHVVYGIAALGYPADVPAPKERKGTFKYFG